MRTAFAAFAAALCAGPALGQPAVGPGPAVDPKPTLALDAGGHTGSISNVLFTPDGRSLVTGSFDKTVRVWDLATGTSRRVFRPPVGPGRDGRIYGMALSPDGKLLAVGGFGVPAEKRGRILLIDLAAGEVVRTLDGHLGVIFGLRFSPDGRRLASCGDDEDVRTWDVATGKPERVLRGHRQRVQSLAFSPDGSRLATASMDHTGAIWDVASGQRLAVLAGHQKGLMAVAWSPDGGLVATGGLDGVIALWDGSGRRRWTSPDRGNEVFRVAFSPDSRRLLYTLGGGLNRFTCHWLDLATGQVRVTFDRHTNSVGAAAVSPDGAWVATAGGDSPDLFVWQAADGKLLQHLNGGNRGLRGLAWAADSKTLTFGSTRRPGVVFPAQPVDRTFRLDEPGFVPLPKGDTLTPARVAAGNVRLDEGGPSTVNVFRDQKPAARLNTPLERDFVASWTLLGPDRAAVGSQLGVFLFDTTTGKLLRTFHGHTATVYNLAPSPDGRFLASASEDQTLRVWRPDRDEPLLSLFTAGDEWIAWTPEGYYACSPGGEKLMGWHLNQGPDKLAVFHPAERFRKQLYRPDVIQRVLSEGDVGKALAKADAERGKPTEKTDVAKILPPEVAITAPSGPAFESKQEKLTVTATARPVGGHPIRSMRLLVDGRPFGGPTGVKRFDGAEPAPAEATWEVDLTIGRHQLAVLAESTASEGKSPAVTVKYVGGEAARAAPAGPRLFVLAVGVSKYQDPTLRLNYPARDAAALVDTFQNLSKPNPFASVEPVLLADEKATRAEVLRGLSDLARRSTPSDCVVVYFAGHGQRDPEGLLYLLPSDADVTNLAGTGIESGQLKNQLAGVKGRVVLILDACHAGAAGKDRGVSDTLARDLSRSESGVIVMCSSLGTQTSQENNEFRRGVYTHALIEGLTGKGGKGMMDGLVYDHHVASYTKDLVKQLTRGEQTPTVAIPGDLPELPLSKP